MITLTTLAESKCDLLSSRTTTPAPGSSTSTASEVDPLAPRGLHGPADPRASAGCDDDAQIAVEAAVALDAAPAGPARDTINGTGEARTDTPPMRL